MTSEKRASMQSTAYEFIKHKITMCEYAPNQLLSEALLQEELGFPVRLYAKPSAGWSRRGWSRFSPSVGSLSPVFRSVISV